MSKKKHRNVAETASIGIAAGGIGGMVNALTTHPLDTLKTTQQTGRGTRFTLNNVLKAYGSKEAWRGVGPSAVKKGVGFGVGLGATFGAEAQIKKVLANLRANENLTKLGFHKTK